MALDKLTLLDENIINTSATNIATNISTSVATTLINNSIQTNYISFPVATANPLTNGWRIYNDGASVAPVDGASGTTTITVTQNTSTPLNSTGDFRLTKTSGASRRGEGFSTDFTIANRHLAKNLQVSFDYEVTSGTLAFDDIRLYIIQDPGGTNTVIEPVNVSIQGTIIGQRIRHLATFQTHISITSYRLCIHVATTTNSSQIIDFNNFRVWEPTQSIGAVITDWISYTPSTTRANTTNRSFYYRRVGGGIQISFGWQYTSGVTSSSTALLTDIFPPGLTLDLTRIAPANGSGFYLRYNVGYYFSNDYGISNHTGTIVWDTNQDPDQLAFFGSAPNGADDNLSGFIECPIVGWGSSVAMSSDSSDSRVVAALCKDNVGSLDSSNGFRYSTIIYDTHGSITLNSSNRTIFTAPVQGYYQVNAQASFAQTGPLIIYKYTRSTNTIAAYGFCSNYNSGANLEVCGSSLVYLDSGDYIYLRTSGAYTTTSSSNCTFSINRVSAGSQVIASVETVACSVNKTSGVATTPNRIASWNTKDLDTHSGFDLTNGTFTVPSSGVYLINASAVNLGNFTSYNQPGFTIRNGTTILSVSTMYFTSSFEPELSTSALRRFIAGDIISLYGYGNGFGCNDLRMNISRIGI